VSYSKELDTLKTLLGSSYSQLSRKIELLPDDEYHELRNALPHMIAHMQDLREEIKEIELDRTTDYERYIAKARKYFTDTDIGILETLQSIDDDAALRYDYIREQLPDHPSGNLLRKRMHRLWRFGLVKYAHGLFDEEGMAAGSGFMLNHRRSEIIDRIVESYRAIDKQTVLIP
jgi:hypothetical protein